MAEWLAEYRPGIDNLRAALDWVFSPGGDAAICVALTAASMPLWVDLSMMAECRRHVERALARLNSVAELDPRQEMHLQGALGVSLNYTTGPVPETQAAWTRTLEIAKSLDDVEYQLRALRGLWAHHMDAGEYRVSLAIANEFNALAATTGDAAALGAADRMAGIILHYLGNQTGARQHLERRLARTVSTVRQSPPVRFLIDQRVAARALLARILWFPIRPYPLRGSPWTKPRRVGMRCRFVMPWLRLRVRSQLSMAMWLRRSASPRSCSTAPENSGLPAGSRAAIASKARC